MDKQKIAEYQFRYDIAREHHLKDKDNKEYLLEMFLMMKQIEVEKDKHLKPLVYSLSILLVICWVSMWLGIGL